MSEDIHTTPTRKVPVVKAEPKTFVVAGNYAQFRNWQDEDREKRRGARYVLFARELMGYTRDTVVLFLGDYYRRPDIGAISDLVADMRYETVFESAFSSGAGR